MSFLVGAHNATVSHSHFTNVGHNQYTNVTVETQNVILPKAEGELILSSLTPVDRSSYYFPPCMEGTRETIFEDIDEWLLDTGARNILWISGSPGVGKSTIASSLVSRLEESGRLGASMFFKRDDATLSDPGAVWRTVAFDLAESDPVIARRVVTNLQEKKVNPGRPDIELHFKYLIEDPLKYKEATAAFDDTVRLGEAPETDQQPGNVDAGTSDQVVKRLENGDILKRPHPVVVLDALDECGSLCSQSSQRKILLSTLTNWSRLPALFKLIVTSRDDGISQAFRNACDNIVLCTGDLVSSDANSDVETFFTRRFAEITTLYPSLLPTWPERSIIAQLTERAAGLFIWADTVVRFVEQGVANEQLDLLLASGFREGADRVNALYAQILHLSFNYCKADIHQRLTAVVGAIVLAKTPLRRIDLGRFVGTLDNEPSLDFILQKLSSVISIGDKDNIIRVCHLSFTDFICNSTPLSEPFAISRSSQSEVIALNCLRVMNRELKFNICGLETSYLRNDEYQDLSSRMERMIPVVLSYACRFFTDHLNDITHQKCDVAVVREIDYFFRTHFLHWLEVVSVHEWMPTAIKALHDITQWLEIYANGLSAFAADADRFVHDFQIPISMSAPHIYLSALPFASRQSRVYQHFRPQFPKTLSLSESAQGYSWSSLTNMIIGQSDHVWSDSFSLDGGYSLSGKGDGTICTWDADTGKILSSPFEENTKRIWSVAFSPDGRCIISVLGHLKLSELGSKDDVGLPGPPDAPAASITSVAFSPSRKRVVSCSADRTIHIWDAESRKIVSSATKLHKNYITSLAFSPDAKCVVSGSWDMTICVWDAATGQILSGPLRGHVGGVNSVAFGPDGRSVVSGSDDRTVRIWGLEMEKTISGPLEGHNDMVNSVSFSPDGRHVASGSDDGIICIWDAKNGKLPERWEYGAFRRIPPYSAVFGVFGEIP